MTAYRFQTQGIAAVLAGATLALLLLLLPWSTGAAQAQPPTAPAIRALGDGSIVLFRHAEAPGVGDPPGFKLGDCSTQRNLDDTGRAQARQIGERLRAQGVEVRAVRSSQWCRAHETAVLAFPQSTVDDDADFNSFFGDNSAEAAQSARALATLRRWRGPGTLVVVTHQVNITALTGVVPASGEGVVVRAVPAAASGRGVDVLGRLRP